MIPSRKQTVHHIIERIAEEQRRTREEAEKRLRGEAYLTEYQVSVEVAIKYMKIGLRTYKGTSLIQARVRLRQEIMRLESLASQSSDPWERSQKAS